MDQKLISLDSEFHKYFLYYRTNDLLWNRTNAGKHLLVINQVCSYNKIKGGQTPPVRSEQYMGPEWF
ncbi:hypothetical protein [Flagellimonas marinaquae]